MGSCLEYIALWNTTPELCLDPEDEYVKHQAYLKSDAALDAKEEAKDAKHAGYRESNAAKLETARQRWQGGTKFTSGHATSRATAVPPGGKLSPTATPSDPATKAAGSWAQATTAAHNEPTDN